MPVDEFRRFRAPCTSQARLGAGSDCEFHIHNEVGDEWSDHGLFLVSVSDFVAAYDTDAF